MRGTRDATVGGSKARTPTRSLRRILSGSPRIDTFISKEVSDVS